jgi:hypothetical protein
MYVQNNPLRYTDPTGHCPECVVEAEPLIDACVQSPSACVEEVTQVGEELVSNAEEIGRGAAEVGGQVSTLAKVGWSALTGYLASLTGDHPQKKQEQKKPAKIAPVVPSPQDAHKNNASPSKKEGHQQGEARAKRDRGGEKGDARRRSNRKRPKDWNKKGGPRGPWPPEPPAPKPRNNTINE